MALPKGFKSSQDLVKAQAQAQAQAQAHVWKHVSNYMSSMSLKCAIQLGIPNIIHSHGEPMTPTQLADAIPMNKSKSTCLRRLMRLLVHSEFFGEDQQDIYYLTPASLILRGDEPLSVMPLALLMLDPIMTDPWHHWSKWFATDDATYTPFAVAHGMSLFEVTGHDERMNCIFNEAMTSDASIVTSLIARDCRHVFVGVRSMVDVGGGVGTAAAAKVFVDAFPGLNCTVLDLPHVVAGLKGTGNLNFVAGDMFDAIPPTDAVFLKSILHDWNDEKCVRILEKCRAAIGSKEKGGKVVVVMNNEKDYVATETQLQWDMAMMVQTSGKERTEQDWAKLFNDAGFSGYQITPLLGLRLSMKIRITIN